MKSLKNIFPKPDEEQNYQLNWLTASFISFFIVFLFGIGDLLVLLSGYWPHLYGVAGVPTARWEEVVCYAPFANAFSIHNLLPVAPSYDRTLFGLSHMPFITMAFSGIILKTISFGNLDIYLLISHSILPMLNFWLIYKIYNIFLRKRWAILLAFFGIGYYSAFSSASYYLNVFLKGGSLIESASLTFPEISRIPFPSMSLLFFLLAFYCTVITKKLREKNVLFLSSLWGLQIYVYFFNFVSGFIFFFFWIIYKTYFANKYNSRGAIFKNISLSFIVTFLISIPFLITSQNEVFKTIQAKLHSGMDASFYIGNWGFIPTYMFPTLLLVMAFYFFRCDIYELFKRFTPILIGVLIDFLMGSINLFSGSIPTALYQHRISGIFFRFFYYIPLLYFIGIPYKRSSLGAVRYIVKIRDTAARLIHNVFYAYDQLIIVTGIFFIAFVMVTGGVRYYKHHQMIISPQMEEASIQLDLLKNMTIKNKTVALENLEANLLLPSLSQNNTLLSASFINFISDDLVLERLILYAKIFGWSQARFLNFMLPSSDFVNLNSYKAGDMIMNRNSFSNGLGYWLYYFNKQLDYRSLNAYVEMLKVKFNQADVIELLSKHKVSTVVSQNPVLTALPGTRVYKTGKYYITFFDIGKTANRLREVL